MKIILCGYHWSGCRALEILQKKKNKIFVYTHKSKYFECNLADHCKKKKKYLLVLKKYQKIIYLLDLI